MRFSKKILTLAILICFISGCATVPSYRIHPEAYEKFKNTKILVILPPDIEVYQITSGGVTEKMDEWSKEARKNVFAAIESELDRKGLTLKVLSVDSLSSEARANLEQTQALFLAVDSSILLHTYGPKEYIFPEKIKDFDYSLGPEVRGLAQGNTFLIVSGFDQISTGGRKAAQAGAIILGAFIGVRLEPAWGGTSVKIALVDADTGRILWYKVRGSAGGYDLRNPESTASLMKDILEDFPTR